MTQPAVTKKERIVFLGDSITEEGSEPAGWVSLITSWTNRAGINVEIINAGVSGHRVEDVLLRLQSDVLELKPDCVVSYIGINDAWQWESLPVDSSIVNRFRDEMETLLIRLKTVALNIFVCTPGVIGERTDGLNACDVLLDTFSEIVRSVANEQGVNVIDLRTLFMEYLCRINPGQHDFGILTRDSVHLNKSGNRFLAGVIFDTLWPGKRINEPV